MNHAIAKLVKEITLYHIGESASVEHPVLPETLGTFWAVLYGSPHGPGLTFTFPGIDGIRISRDGSYESITDIPLEAVARMLESVIERNKQRMRNYLGVTEAPLLVPTFNILFPEGYESIKQNLSDLLCPTKDPSKYISSLNYGGVGRFFDEVKGKVNISDHTTFYGVLLDELRELMAVYEAGTLLSRDLTLKDFNFVIGGPDDVNLVDINKQRLQRGIGTSTVFYIERIRPS